MAERRHGFYAVACAAALVLGSCGDPADPADDTPPIVQQDATPLNQELPLDFDGDSPELVVGSDGTLHMSYRRTTASKAAAVYYARKAPLANEWTTPVKVLNSDNVSYRWFNHPKLAIDAEQRVHFAWGPEPYDHNGVFYSNCVRCDGTDFPPAVRVTTDFSEWLELGVSASGVVHIVASQLYYQRPGGGYDTREQMVHYRSTNKGQSFVSESICRPSYRDLSLKVDGEDVHLLMRFRDLRHARYVDDGSGTRRWQNIGVPTRGAGVSEMYPFTSGPSLSGFVYSAWGQHWPEHVYFSGPGGETVQLSSKDISFKPNNVQAWQDKQGRRVALWADSDGYLHQNLWNGTTWTGDSRISSKVRGSLDQGGMKRAAIWEWMGKHGTVIWPVIGMAEHEGNYHVVYRASEVLNKDGLTEVGRFHYVRYRPFD
jgi:hypothetical protein